MPFNSATKTTVCPDLGAALLLLKDAQVEVVSLRFCVERTYHRRNLPCPTASTTRENLPASLRLDLFVCYQEADSNAPACAQVTTTLTGTDCTEQLKILLSFDVPYVGYDLDLDLCWLFYLGLPIPTRLWDVRIAHRALTLGKINCKARSACATSQRGKIESEQQLRHNIRDSLELNAIAAAYRVLMADFSLIRTLLDIYFRQVAVANATDTFLHLINVEMPWVAVNARMGFDGVRINREKHDRLLRHATTVLADLSPKLTDLGINNPNSDVVLQDFVQGIGLAEPFQLSTNRYAFTDERLCAQEHSNPAFALIRAYRKAQHICSTQQAVKKALSLDDRVHAQHIQLGTETGRQTCKDPNLHSLDRIQKNLVIPSPGCAIGETDYCQHEIGVAAGLSNDTELIRMYNDGDLYTQMAQRFYSGDVKIERGAEVWETQVFRERYPHLREQLKVVTLASIYGQESHGLAKALNVSTAQARQYQQQFFALFPDLHIMLTRTVQDYLRQGYVEIVGGLRIYLDQHPSITVSARTRMAKNYPIQASATVIFKSAGIRIANELQHYQARLLIPMHDSFVFEAPQECFTDVAALIAEIMVDEFRRYFPVLKPQVNMNCSRPDRWIKEVGCEQALELYLQSSSPPFNDPSFQLPMKPQRRLPDGLLY